MKTWIFDRIPPRNTALDATNRFYAGATDVPLLLIGLGLLLALAIWS